MTDDPELTAPSPVLQAAQEHSLGALVAVRKGTNPFVAAAVALVVGGICYGLLELLTRNTTDLNLPRSVEKVIGFLGLYVSSAIFIAFFMAWLGKYPLYKIVPVAILIPVALFFMFEVWFLVPLPKGPLETALGY